MKVLVGNIQRFCLDDGPGIRTTVFFKGCSIRCPWCCNPENLDAKIALGKSGTTYGSWMSEEEILEIILKDRHYYQNGGGVTFSGGECLLTLLKTAQLLQQLKDQGINIAVETSLFVPAEHLKAVAAFIDFFYIDFKLLLKKDAQEVLGGNVDWFFENLDYFAETDCLKKIHPRIPLVPGLTDKTDNLEAIVAAFKKYHLQDVELFSVHNMGSEKYKDLDLPYHPFSPMPNEAMEAISLFFERNSIKVRVLKL